VSNKFGMLSVSVYSFIHENGELKLEISQNDKDQYWYSMSKLIDVKVYYRVGIAHK